MRHRQHVLLNPPVQKKIRAPAGFTAQRTACLQPLGHPQPAPKQMRITSTNESPKLNGRINSLGFIFDASHPPKNALDLLLRNTAFRLSRPHPSLSPTPWGLSPSILLPAEKGFQNSRVYKSGGASTPAPLPTLPPVTLDTKYSEELPAANDSPDKVDKRTRTGNSPDPPSLPPSPSRLHQFTAGRFRISHSAFLAQRAHETELGGCVVLGNLRNHKSEEQDRGIADFSPMHVHHLRTLLLYWA